MRWPWVSDEDESGSPVAKFDLLIDEIIDDFRHTVAVHERKLHELREALRDR